MMPGLGFTETILLVIVAIVVIGPKDLPLMMRKFGRFTGKMRSLAFEFRQGFDELGRQAELEELRREVADLKKHTVIAELQQELEESNARLHTDFQETKSLPRATRSAALTSPDGSQSADLAPDPALDPAPAPSPAAPEASASAEQGEGNRIAPPRTEVAAE